MQVSSLALPPSSLVWNEITSVITFLLRKKFMATRESEIKKQKHTVIHVSQFIAQFSHTYLKYPRPAILQAESFLTMRKWSNFTQLCDSMDPTVFSGLKSSQVNQLCLGEGICVGSIIYYFNQFFQTFSPLKSAFMQVRSAPYLDKETQVKFYPFILKEENLEKETETLRFLQASYKIAYALKQSESLEFVSNNVLKKRNLEIVRRLPDLQVSGKLAFTIQELLPELKKLSLEGENKGYLMGLSGINHHALALYLHPPFHFMDPSSGIMIGENVEDLALFLAAYLTEKFPECHSFALLELMPKF